MPLDYMSSATKVLKRANYQASDADIQKLATNMKMLEERGMTELNRKLLPWTQKSNCRLLQMPKRIRDTLAEHNFAIKLISYHNQNVEISYEPNEGLQYPIDFKIILGELTYWVQMKRLANLERENKQNNIMRKIEEKAKKENIGMFLGCDLSDSFSEKDIPKFIEFIASKSSNPEKGREYGFPDDEKPKAKVDFWHPNKSEVSSLTLVFSGDMDMVNETGLAKNQIKGSLIKAARAFKWNVCKSTINLIAMDADKYKDIDICDAVFGTEFGIFSHEKHSWSRQRDGFFLLPKYSKKVAGVIALKSKERSPVPDYFATLYVNDVFKDRISDFNKLLSFNNVIHFKMRHPMGKGNFDIGMNLNQCFIG